MAHASSHNISTAKEKVRPDGGGFATFGWAAKIIGLVGIAAAVGLAMTAGTGLRRFYFGYLVNFTFFLSISVGGIFFVLIQHLTRAGWSVGVRRIGETIAAGMPVLFILSIPILISVVTQKGQLYPWAVPIATEAGGGLRGESVGGPETAHPAETAVAPQASPRQKTESAVADHDEATSVAAVAEGAGHSEVSHAEALHELSSSKRQFLSTPFYLARVVLYFAIWSGIGVWYWRKSIKQDATGDISITSTLQARSAPLVLIFALTLTLASFDIIMSLDPLWYSTMFGVYYFSGSALSIFAVLIVVVTILQSRGYLAHSITQEHVHDLGKFLFAFTFFWGYIAFSQYMLIWYGAIPEEVGWLARHGATTVKADVIPWSYWLIAVLFGHLFIPFAGLLSRHVKRNRAAIVFWAIWLLVFHWMDLAWAILPEYSSRLSVGLPELLSFVGIGGVYVGTLVLMAKGHSLIAVGDPRVAESLAFENI